MLPFYKKYWRTAFDIGLVVLTVYLIMSLFSYLYKIATPIFLSFLIYLMIEPLARFLHRRGMQKAIASAISVLLFIILLLSVFFGLGVILIAQISSLISNLPQYAGILQHSVSDALGYLQSKLNLLPDNITSEVNKHLGTIATKGSDIAISLLNMILGSLKSVSSFLINFGIGIILAYFLSAEIESWRKFAEDKTPNTFKNVYNFLRINVFRGIGGYIKAQFKLISITFVMVFISLLLLGVPNILSLALLSALLDLLPLLGIPVLFIPWSIYLFVIGNSSLAIWLLIVLALVMLVRQILEPKITGNTLGVSAFTMLSCMIISLSLFGVAGLILSPILLILIKALIDQGYLKSWIRLPAEDFDRANS